MKIRYTVTKPTGEWAVVEGGAALDVLMVALSLSTTGLVGVTVEAQAENTAWRTDWLDPKLRET